MWEKNTTAPAAEQAQCTLVMKVSRNGPERRSPRSGAPQKGKKAFRGPKNNTIFTGALDSSPFRGSETLVVLILKA